MSKSNRIQVEDTYSDRDGSRIRVTVDGEEILNWDDNAHVDCPEDLTWSRMLSSIFWAGVKAGRMTAEDKSE